VPWESTVWNGKKMAIPLEIRTAVMYYRKDLLAKVNRPVPRSLDELIDTGKQLSQLPNTQGVVLGLARAGDAVAMIEPFYSLMWSAGGEVVDKNGKAVFNSPAGVKVVGKLKEMFDKGAMPRSALAYTYEEVYSGVRSGTAAVAFLGSQRVVAARDAGKLGANLATAPLPGFTAGKPAPAHAFGWQLVIGKDSKQKPEAWKFIQHMTSTEAQVRRAQATGELPTRKSAYKHEFFLAPEANEVREWVSYVGSNPQTANYPRRFTEMSQLIVDAIQQVVLSNADPKQALDKAAERFNSLR
jgi:multiple sugar transport system substrate-binding protein